MSAKIHIQIRANGAAVMRKEWKLDEIKKLESLYEGGSSRADMELAMGRPWSSIKHAIWYYKMKRKEQPKTAKVLTGVGSYFCAAHRDKLTGKLHGHTWDIVAWFISDKNAVSLQSDLKGFLERFDHSVLDDDCSWGEELAKTILCSLENCCEVEVRRESERIYAKAIASA